MVYSNARKPVNLSIEQNLLMLEKYAALPCGFDGYDAPAISADAIEVSKELVRALSKQPDISPTCRGSIQFEYEKDNGEYFEFEIVSKNDIKYLFKNADGYTEGKTEQIEIPILVDRFLQKHL